MLAAWLAYLLCVGVRELFCYRGGRGTGWEEEEAGRFEMLGAG